MFRLAGRADVTRSTRTGLRFPAPLRPAAPPVRAGFLTWVRWG